MTSRTDRRPSLHVVCTWKSHSRNGSYPGTLHPHIQMVGIRRTMTQDFGPEISNVQAKHLALAHHAIPPRRRPDPTVARQHDGPDRCQSPAKIRVLAVKFHRAIEAANPVERLTPHREIAAV